MKKLTPALLLLSVFLTGNLFAQNRSVSFEHITFAEGLAKAKAANKPIFFDGYTTWCGPCKYMANTVFTQDKVADFFNANFVNVKFDMEQGEGLELAKKYEVKAYPTFLILDTAGNLIHRIVGGGEADEFIEKVKAGLNPATSLAGQKAKYQEGNREPEFVKGYLKTLQDAYMETEAQEIATTYIRSLKEKEKTSKENWPIYNDFINDASSKEFLFILTNRIKFTDAVGDSAVTAKVSSVFSEKAMTFLANRKGSVYSKEEANKLRNLIIASKPADIQKYTTILDMADAKFAKNASALAGIVNTSMAKVQFSDQECYSILSMIVPVVAENGAKNDKELVSAFIDSRIAALKEPKAKPYFEKMKNKLTGTTEEAKK